MKVRKGFVSNSSSSSFCLLGIYVGFDEGGWDYVYNQPKEWQELFEKSGLQLACGIQEGDDSVYLGVKIENLPDDKTIGELKIEVKDKLTKLGFDKKVDFIHKGGYNG